ncbi:MAG: tyrosine--tRNA ligase [bacterium]
MLEIEQQLKEIKKGVLEIIEEEELKQKLQNSLKTNTPLKIKLGVDPSVPDIHLGHTVPIRKLKQFQNLGHEVIFIIGDFTGRIGDPSGKSSTRKLLTQEQVIKNAQTYKEQIFQILDESKTQLLLNSQWYNKMNFAEIIKLSSAITLAKILEHGTFRKRYEQNKDISLIEFMYPLIQAYDSVQVKADVEIGGSDQRFNLLIGRIIQKHYGQVPQIAITLPLLEGIDGKEKMSKSLGNYIGINESSKEIFGKTMSIPDDLMFKYYKLLTTFSSDEIENFEKKMKNNILHPMIIKKKLAYEIVKIYHNETEAKKSYEEFEKIFSQKKIPDEIPEIEIKDEKLGIIKLLIISGLVNSNSEARRLIEQKAVDVDKINITNINEEILIKNDMILKVGKRKFVRIKK